MQSNKNTLRPAAQSNTQPSTQSNTGSSASMNQRSVPTLTNSPGCAPSGFPTSSTKLGETLLENESVTALSRGELLDLFGSRPAAKPTQAASTQSARTPQTTQRPALRRHSGDARPSLYPNPNPTAKKPSRTVRVDAWATPVSVSWTRTRPPIRKVARRSQSTDWALPY